MQPRKRKQTRRKLTGQRVQFIVGLIEDWPLRKILTWEGVVALILKETGHVWTRQGLQAHDDIKAAYAAKTSAYRGFHKTGKIPKNKTPTQSIWEQKVKREQDKYSKLQKTLRWFDERFVRHIANAIRFGITQEQLEEPTIAPERGQTDPAKNIKSSRK